MKTLTKIVLALTISLLASCANQPKTSYIAPDMQKDSLRIIVKDVSKIIAIQNPNKNTCYSFHQDFFGKILATKLSKLGYETTFSAGPEEDSPSCNTVRYIIDWVLNDSVYVALTINNSQRYTRSYRVENNRLTPNPLNIIGEKDE